MFGRRFRPAQPYLYRMSLLVSNATLAPAPALPLVTVVALCYNHAAFLRAALDSLLHQTYPCVEVVLVDDGSTDSSIAILHEYAAANPTWKTVFLSQNIGNCAAFNRGFAKAQGEFIIDFATDDILLPERISRQIAAFQQLDASYGAVYTNAELIDEAGHFVRLHQRPDAHGLLHPRPASGWVFAEVLRRYFISSPTLMIRRATLQALGGYDEALTYEDFDLWVRAARNWQFFYLDEVLTRKRLHPSSKSAKGYRPGDPYVASTIQVCRKAAALCRTPDELAALAVRLRWELRQAVRWRNHAEARELYGMLQQTGTATPLDRALGLYLSVIS